MYLVINDTYDRYGLGDGLSDEERISEYKYINEQLRKFVSKTQVPVFDCGSDLNKMAEYVRSMFKTLPEYADDRKTLVYNFVRDTWLLELLNVIVFIGEEEEEE